MTAIESESGWLRAESRSSWYANEQWQSHPVDSTGCVVKARWVQPLELLRVEARFWDDYYSAYCLALGPCEPPGGLVPEASPEVPAPVEAEKEPSVEVEAEASEPKRKRPKRLEQADPSDD